MILVPFKLSAQAKQRLAPVLSQPARTELAQAMLQDVLETLAGWTQRPAVSVVTTDPFARELAQSLSFEVIADGNRSETEAIETATAMCQARGVSATLVIPGDIPLIETWELESILSSAPEEGSVLVPAADGRGTNAALRCPAGLFPLRFGNDSFRPHHATAQATGKPCVVLELPGIALDIDNPEDLQELAIRAGQRRSQKLAREWGFGERPKAANE